MNATDNETLVECITGCIYAHSSISLFPREVIEAARDIAAKYVLPVIEQRDELLKALEALIEALPEGICSGEQVSPALDTAYAAIDNVKGGM